MTLSLPCDVYVLMRVSVCAYACQLSPSPRTLSVWIPTHGSVAMNAWTLPPFCLSTATAACTTGPHTTHTHTAAKTSITARAPQWYRHKIVHHSAGDAHKNIQLTHL